MNWDKSKAIQYLKNNAEPPYGVGQCAKYVRKAIEAGGLVIGQTASAKDYGPLLVAAGFKATTPPYQSADVAVIDGFAKDAAPGVQKDHLDGHMAMYDGTQWISDFVQTGAIPYPGSDYVKAAPAFVIYRY